MSLREKLRDQPAIFVAITGPKGSGKTIMLHYFCGLYHSRGGRVLTESGDRICMPDGKGGYLNIAEIPDGNFENSLLAIDVVTWTTKNIAPYSLLRLDYLKQQHGLSVVIVVQKFEFLLPEIQDAVRVIYECQDYYSSVSQSYEGRPIERGEIIYVTLQDRVFTEGVTSAFVIDARPLWACVGASTK